MTNEERKVFELALEALKKARRKILTIEECHAAIMFIKEALAQPEQRAQLLFEVDGEMLTASQMMGIELFNFQQATGCDTAAEFLAKPEHDCTRSHPHEEMSKECELRTEIARLTNCLSRVNAQAEHFEREWYLLGDENERLKAQPTSGDYALGYSIGFGEGHSAGKALAQPEQEPLTENGMYRLGYHNGYGFGEAYGKANAPQRTWVGLTDEEIDQGLLRSNYALQTAGAWRDGVEWATKQLKDKNK